MKASEEHSTVRGNKWQIKDAGTHLPQVVDHALHEGPQAIILKGRRVAVVVSAEEFQKLSSSSQKAKGVRTGILQYAGMLQDLTEEETKVFDEAVKRKSLFGGRKIKI